MIEINVVADDKQIQTVLRRLAALNHDLTPVFNDIGEYLILSHKLRFEACESPDGTKWKANHPLTPKGDIKKPLHGETLNLRDKMVYQASRDSLQFAPGNSAQAYAAIHQFGGIIKPKNGKALRFPVAGGGYRVMKQVTIPARPYLGLSETDKRMVLRKLTAEYAYAAQAG